MPDGVLFSGVVPLRLNDSKTVAGMVFYIAVVARASANHPDAALGSEDHVALYSRGSHRRTQSQPSIILSLLCQVKHYGNVCGIVIWRVAFTMVSPFAAAFEYFSWHNWVRSVYPYYSAASLSLWYSFVRVLRRQS